MEKKLRVAIIGCGRIATYTRPELLAELHAGYLPYNHAESIQINSSMEIVALCDNYAPNLDRAAERFRIEKKFSDYKKLISEIKPDIISIGTRTPSKPEIISYAAKHGVKGIHLEKPIANSMRDTKDALRVMTSHQVHFTYGTIRRFMDIFSAARKLMDEGKIGQVLNIEIRFGKGLLFWHHPHSVDAILYLNCGSRVISVQASCTMEKYEDPTLLIDEDPMIDHAYMEFENGVSGTISSLPGNDIVITGTNGSLLIAADARWIELIKVKTQGFIVIKEIERIDITPTMSGSQRAFYELSQGILANQKTSITASDIEFGQEILFLITLSALRDGRKLAPSDLPTDFTILAKTSGMNA
jgi:predicted dehydrogenase